MIPSRKGNTGPTTVVLAATPSLCGPRPRVLALFLLLLASSFLFSSGVLAAPSSARLNGFVTLAYLPIMQQSLLAYQVANPELQGAVTLTGQSGFAAGQAAALSGNYDFTITTSSVPDDTRATNPTMRSYPLLASAVALNYFLPDTVGSAQLKLTNLAICKMSRGNITHWDDPAIVTSNPTLTLPHTRVIWLHQNFANDIHTAVTRICDKVDPDWKWGVTNLPKPAFDGVVLISQAQSAGGLAAYCLSHPFALGWGTVNVAPVVSIINAAGNPVVPSASTVGQAFLELAANGVLEGGNGYDLSNAASAFAWPSNLQGWLWIDGDKLRSTCAAKAALLRFILWFYTSETVATIAASLYATPPPQMFLAQSGLLATIRSEVQCDGEQLVGTDTSVALIQGNARIATALDFFTNLYRRIDTSYSYNFRTLDDALALQRIAIGEISFAVVDPMVLTQEQIRTFQEPSTSVDAEGNTVSRSGGLIMPAFLSGVVPTFSLPLSVTALYAARAKAQDLLGLPELYPLVLDKETVAAVFLGLVNTWTDARLLLLNPQLEVYFNRTGASTTLKVITCCTSSSDPMVATGILAHHILRTRAANETLGRNAAALTPRTFWAAVKAANPAGTANHVMVPRENVAAGQLTLQPGSVSVKLITSATSAQASEFQMKVTGPKGKPVVYPGTWAGMADCVSIGGTQTEAQMAANLAMLIRDPGFVHTWPFDYCYPLASLSAFAVATSFESSGVAMAAAATSWSTTSSGQVAATSGLSSPTCLRAQANLQLLSWLQTSEVVSLAAKNSGLYRIADEPAAELVVLNALNQATCDGETLLITLPVIWTMPKAATVFAYVAAILVIIMCAAAIAGLLYYRSHSALRSSSPLLMVQVAVGVALMVASLVPWASDVDDSSCLSFQWLVNLGFTLAFSPIFAKTWRVYQINSAKKIKGVRVSSGKVAASIIVMVLVELVVLAAWTGVSPLRPVLFQRPTNQLNGAIRHITHCAVQGSGTGFLALEAGLKGLLLLLGSLMGFSTRRLGSAFVDTRSMTRAVYLTVVGGLAAAAVLVAIDTRGDTLIWIVMLLFLWISLVTWACVFGTKAAAIVQGPGNMLGEHSSMHSSMSSDGSALRSIAGMSVAQLRAYRASLYAKIAQVQEALGISTNKSEGTLLHPAPVPAENRFAAAARLPSNKVAPVATPTSAATVTATGTPTAASSAAPPSALRVRMISTAASTASDADTAITITDVVSKGSGRAPSPHDFHRGRPAVHSPAPTAEHREGRVSHVSVGDSEGDSAERERISGDGSPGASAAPAHEQHAGSPTMAPLSVVSADASAVDPPPVRIAVSLATRPSSRFVNQVHAIV